MAYVRKTTQKRTSRKRRSGKSYPADLERYTYYQLVKGVREGGTVRQVVLAHLGRNETPEAALEDWQQQAAYWRGSAADNRLAAQWIRDGRAERSPRKDIREGHTLVYRIPKDALPDDSPERAESNIFRNAPYFHAYGTAEDVEAEAEKFIAKAEEYEERIVRLRAVL
jgi:hypothetical protein